MHDDVPLRQYFEALREADQRAIAAALAAAKEAVAAALVAAEKAVAKAEQAQNLKNEAANEWRGTLTDLTVRFATVEGLSSLGERTRILEEWRAGARGERTGLYLAVGAAFSILSAMATAVGMWVALH